MSGIYCLCNHSAADHGMSDTEAQIALRYGNRCTKCICSSYEHDPIYEPPPQPSSLADDSPGVELR